MSRFLRREVLDTFFLVLNYVRNWLLASSYGCELGEKERQDLEYAIVQLKLYRLIYCSGLSPLTLANRLTRLDRRLSIVSPEMLYKILTTVDKGMSYDLRANVAYLAESHKIFYTDRKDFYEECVKVLSEVTGINHSIVLNYNIVEEIA